MDERTRKHLSTARANRAYALAILNDEATSVTELNWAAVAAFYAAMHAVNAYLWDVARLEPANHRDRRAIILSWPALDALRFSYNVLFDHSLRARYEPGYSMSMTSFATLVNRHLPHVIATVERALPDDEAGTP